MAGGIMVDEPDTWETNGPQRREGSSGQVALVASVAELAASILSTHDLSTDVITELLRNNTPWILSPWRPPPLGIFSAWSAPAFVERESI
jgi:hypothetical protein